MHGIDERRGEEEKRAYGIEEMRGEEGAQDRWGEIEEATACSNNTRGG